MDAVISALTGTNGLSASSFFTVVADTMPFVVLLVPICLGLLILRRLIKGASKAKVRV